MKHDINELLKLLQSQIDESGSQKAFAIRNKISAQYVNDVIKRRRKPGPKILGILGVNISVVYEKEDEGGQSCSD